MSFMKSWKLKNPTVQPIAALNTQSLEAQPKPEDNIVQSVKPVDNQMTKFNGLKRRLAHFRNDFKESKD